MPRSSILLALFSSAIFAAVFYAVASSAFLQTDENLFRDMNSLGGTPVFGIAALAVTQFGSEFIVAAIGFAIYFFAPGGRRLGMGILAAMVASDAVLFVLKSSYFRPRPYLTLSQVNLPFGPDEGSSFPSGHTTRAFALFSMIPLSRGKKYVFVVAISIAVALSRVILGVHYPLDVLGGALLGLTLALLTGLVIGPFSRRFPRLFREGDHLVA